MVVNLSGCLLHVDDHYPNVRRHDVCFFSVLRGQAKNKKTAVTFFGSIAASVTFDGLAATSVQCGWKAKVQGMCPMLLMR